MKDQMLDLYTLLLKDEELHPNFKYLLEAPEATRTVIQEWTKGFVDRDGKIVKEFQSTFNSSFWEFYLHAAFTELGFSSDYSVESPDFLLSKGEEQLVAEAVIANNPNEGQPEWKRELLPDFSPKLVHEVVELAMIRLLSAITSKHKKFINSYSKLSHVQGKPFVLCVAPYEQPFFFAQGDQAIRKVLYKFDAPIYQYDNDGEVRILGKSEVPEVVNHNGTDLKLGLFTDDRMKEISAIVFSSSATMTKAKAMKSEAYPLTLFSAARYQKKEWATPYTIASYGGAYNETLLDGLHIYLNPFAEIPFNPNIFYNADIALHQYDPETETPYEQLNDGFLLSHGCMTFNPVKDFKKQQVEQAKEEFPSFIAEWKEGELRKVDANVGTGINNHMAHLDGWTIVVFMDEIDSDWGAIAKEGVFYSLQQFILAHCEDTPGLQSFFVSKEEAYEDIKKQIEKIKKEKSNEKSMH